MTFLDVRGLSKTFNGRRGDVAHAVRDVDFSLSSGERLAIVGMSGSGKSTLLHLILGLTEPTSGTVTFDNRLVTGRRKRDWFHRRVQFVPQDPSTSLNPTMSVVDCVQEPLACMRIGSHADQERRARTMLDAVGLSGLEGRRPAQLSGGQRQRVAIARAFSIAPDLVIADEAVSDLDADVRLDTLNTITRLCDDNDIALILVTHDLGVAAHTCDQVAVLDHGTIVEHGPVRDVFTCPQAPVTQALLDAVLTLPRMSQTTQTLRIS